MVSCELVSRTESGVMQIVAVLVCLLGCGTWTKMQEPMLEEGPRRRGWYRVMWNARSCLDSYQSGRVVHA